MAFPFDIRAARYSGTRLQTLCTPAHFQQYSKSSPPGGTAHTSSHSADVHILTRARLHSVKALNFYFPLIKRALPIFSSHNEPSRSELSVEVCTASTQGGRGCSEHQAYSITRRERVRGREKKEWANISECRVALWSPSLPPYSGTAHRQTADASHASVRGAPPSTPTRCRYVWGALTFGLLKMAPPAPRQRRNKNETPPR